jgi:hypothetical protein
MRHLRRNCQCEVLDLGEIQMKRKLLIFVAALIVFCFTAGAYAIKSSYAATAKADCCCCKGDSCPMGGDCCKDKDNCPMKDKMASAENAADMSKVVVAGDGDSCCSCCHHQS